MLVDDDLQVRSSNSECIRIRRSADLKLFEYVKKSDWLERIERGFGYRKLGQLFRTFEEQGF